jgi:serine/threonine protein kinase
MQDNIEDNEEAIVSPGIDIGRYTDARYLAEGLFSVIYKAVAPDDVHFPPHIPSKKKLVALKVTTPSLMQPPHNSKREAEILRLAASDHVIPVLEAFREAGTRFVIVFPFMPFELNRLLQDQKLSSVQIRNLLRDLFSALAFIHSQDIIHRDIKPSNIMVSALDGHAYLADFGISWSSKVAGSEAPDSKITDVGTTCYRPPELLFGDKQYGCSLDLWAAGCTVAEALHPDHPTLFDSGELGSDLALIHSIFTKLGTPDLIVWPVRQG